MTPSDGYKKGLSAMRFEFNFSSTPLRKVQLSYDTIGEGGVEKTFVSQWFFGR